MTAPLLPTEINDFTQLSREGLSDRVRTLFSQVNPNWVDYSSNYPENLLLEGMATLAACVAGANDEAVRQLFAATVTERKAIIKMGRPLGFDLSGRTYAEVDGYFSIPNSGTASYQISIPIGTRILSPSGLVFSTEAACQILVGANTSENVTSGKYEEYTDELLSDGTANQEFQISRSPVIDDDYTVEAVNGTYSDSDVNGIQYRTFLDMSPDTKGYIAIKDQNGSVSIGFGNGVYGEIPPEGTLSITYKVGGGYIGAVSPNSSWVVIDTLTDSMGNPVTLNWNNPAASTAGIDEMTVEEARAQIPAFRRLLHAAVNESQYETVAIKAGRMARAALITSNSDATIDENIGILYCIAYGSAYSTSGYYPPAAPTAAQLAAVNAALADTGEYPDLLDFNVTAQAATFKDLNITVRITKNSNYTGAQARVTIEDSLQQLFAVATDALVANSNIDFGFKLLDANGDPDYLIAWSKVRNSVYNSAGVRDIPPSDIDFLINGSRSSYTLQPHEFPRLGTITIYDLDESGVEI
jgi:hypothetical protein